MCRVTIYHKFGSVEQHPLPTSQFSQSGVWHSAVGSTAQSHKAKIRCQPGVHVYRLPRKVHFQEQHFCCWQNSVPCGWKTDTLLSLLTVSGDHSRLLEAACVHCHGVLQLQASEGTLNPSYDSNLHPPTLTPTSGVKGFRN